MPGVSIRVAAVAERPMLEALQLRASMHGGRYAVDLLTNPDAIEIPDEQFDAGLVRVAEVDGAPAGFAVLLPPVDGACELDGLFVEPDAMSTGVGRRLIEDAVAGARRCGASVIEVVASPEAAGFYRRLGFAEGDEVATRFGPAIRMRRSVTRD